MFWIVAARSYSTADVGADAALISAMVFLSRRRAAEPRERVQPLRADRGHRDAPARAAGYLASVALAVVAARVFVAGIGCGRPSSRCSAHEHWRAAWFVVATVVWTIFVLQDAVLTGLGEAPWVLAENAAYGVVKLLVLRRGRGRCSRTWACSSRGRCR